MSDLAFTHTLTKDGADPINVTLLADGTLQGAPEGVLSQNDTVYTVSGTNDEWAVSKYDANAPVAEPTGTGAEESTGTGADESIGSATEGGRRQRRSQKKGGRKSKKCYGGKKSKKQQKGGKRKSQKQQKGLYGGKKQQKKQQKQEPEQM